MSQQKTAFRMAVSRLKPPASANFSLALWEAAYQKHRATEADDRLFQAAQWIAEEAMAGRSAGQAVLRQALTQLTPEWSTILAVASLNREYRTATTIAKNAQSSGMLSADAIAAERIRGAEGQMFSVSDVAELGIDMTENWLFDANHSTGTSPATGNLAPIVVEATRSYSFRKSLNALWNGAWIDGNYCEIDSDGTSRWKPGDRYRAALIAAWQARQEANLMNFPNIDRTVWPKLSATDRRKRSRGWGVTAICGSSSNPKFKVSALRFLSRYMPAYNFERASLEGSHLADFLDSAMNGNAVMTVSNLLLAWHAIYDIAQLLVKRAPLPTSLSPQEARALALTASRSAICDAVCRALRISENDAEKIVTFLTFQFQTGGTKKDAGNKGLWAAPLVPIPGTNEMALPLPVLTTSNPARRAEAWLEKGGINDSNPLGSRGVRYETLYRERVCKAVARNAKFTRANCAANEIKKSETFPEQIDLVVAFGGLCLVGEVKFFLMPADPHERDRYDKKLRDAAGQAKRKAAALDLRRDVLASNLAVSLEQAKALKLIPLIVTAQGYGFSTSVDDVLVVEAEFLRLYLSGDSIVTARALIPANGQWTDASTQIYGSEQAAALNFEKTMQAPFVLMRFVDRVEWGETAFPTLMHHNTLIEVPLLGDIKGFERMQAEAMRAKLS